MGFIQPGKALKKQKTGKKSKTSTKRDTLDTRSRREPGNPRDDSIPTVTEQLIEEIKEEKEPISLLERFPTEIVHEIFIYSDLSALPFVNKHLNGVLSYRHHLGMKVIMNYYHDLNSGIDDLHNQYAGKRYVLDSRVLDYKFITYELLSGLSDRIDLILPLDEIQRETERRLTEHKEIIEEREKESLRRLAMSDVEVHEEMADRAEMAFNRLEIQDQMENTEQTPDVAIDSYEEIPERFHQDLTEDKVRIVEFLGSKNMRYKHFSHTLHDLIETEGDSLTLKVLQSLLEVSTTPNSLTSIHPVVAAFKRESQIELDILKWMVRLLSEEQKNDDNLWAFLIAKKSSFLIDLLEHAGGRPGHNALVLMNSGVANLYR